MLECHSKNLLQLELNKEIYTKHEASLKFVDGEGGGGVSPICPPY